MISTRKRLLLVIGISLTLMACDQSSDSRSASGSTEKENPVVDAGPTTADGKYQVGDRLQPSQLASATDELRTLEWDELIPQDYDPMVLLEEVDLDKMEDGDPRAQELLDELKAAWADAPPVEELDGIKVRLPGFAVPLEGDEKVVTEMLLVPYFGACIHVPPPPSNQIVHVLPQTPVSQETLYDAIWIEGTLSVERSETKSGSAGYKLVATDIKPYE